MAFLGVSWITNKYRVSQNLNDFFIEPYTPDETLLRWIRLNKLRFSKKGVMTFGRMATSMSTKNGNFNLFGTNRGCYTFGCNQRKPCHPRTPLGLHFTPTPRPPTHPLWPTLSPTHPPGWGVGGDKYKPRVGGWGGVGGWVGGNILTLEDAIFGTERHNFATRGPDFDTILILKGTMSPLKDATGH